MGHGHAGAGRLEHFAFDDLAIVAFKLDGQLACGREPEVGCAILITEGMTADHDWLGPARHQARYVLTDDRRAGK